MVCQVTFLEEIQKLHERQGYTQCCTQNVCPVEVELPLVPFQLQQLELTDHTPEQQTQCCQLTLPPI